MKRYLCAIAMAMSSMLMALPVGNPADPSLLRQGMYQCDGWMDDCGFLSCFVNKLSMRFGYYQDNVAQRNLTQIVGTSSSNQDTLESYVNTYAGYLALNYCERFDVFVTLGTTNFRYESNFLDWGLGETPSSNLVADDNGPATAVSDNGFSWSVGGRWAIWECAGWTIGLEGQYLQGRPDFQYLAINTTTDSNIGLYMPSASTGTKYSEWQVGLGAAYRVGFIVPYAAVKWSGAKLTTNQPPFQLNTGNPATTQFTLRDLEESKNTGFAVGLTFVSCDMGSFTMESRFGDEVGYYFNGQLRF